MDNKVEEFFKLLGVEPFEKFKLADGVYQCSGSVGITYRVNSNLNIESCSDGIWERSDYSVLHIIKGDYIIKKMPKITEKEQIAIDYAKACWCNWMAKDKDCSIFCYIEKPTKDGNGRWRPKGKYYAINIPISFISWDDKEPYYIGD